jgi:RND family efflux transporter MFP subunit
MALDNKSYELSSLKIDADKKFDDRPRSRKWLWFVLIGIAAVIVIGFFRLQDSVTPAMSVKTGTVSYLSGSDATADLVATGYVVAQRLAEVASKGTGRLAFIGYDEGDRVTSGDVIARLENNDIEASLELARARLQQARVDTLNTARQYRRQTTLLDSGAVTVEMLEQAETAWLSAKAALSAAEAQVQIAEVDLDNTIIRAPFDGTVLSKNAEVGEIVAPFASSASSKGSVVTLADMSSLEVEADVNEANINRVKTGQPCEIILDAYPTVRYRARVKKIVPTADRSRATVLTRVEFLELDDKVLPEMSARINFFVDEQPEEQTATALVIPKDALTSRDGQTVAFRITGEIAHLVPVRVGRELGGFTEVISGLSDGDRVILSPPGKLTDGQKVSLSN